MATQETITARPKRRLKAPVLRLVPAPPPPSEFIMTTQGPIRRTEFEMLEGVKEFVARQVQSTHGMSAARARTLVLEAIDDFVKDICQKPGASQGVRLFSLHLGKYMRELARKSMGERDTKREEVSHG